VITLVRMDLLPGDVLKEIISHLSFASIYRLKVTSSDMCLALTGAQHITTVHAECYEGVNMRNFLILSRDFSIAAPPILYGLMTCKIFKRYYRLYKPEETVVSSHAVSRGLTKNLLRKQPPGMNLVIVVDQRNLMTIAKVEPHLTVEALEVIADDKITIEVCMQLLRLSQQHISHLNLRGMINDMDVVFRLLPHGLKSLAISAVSGVYNARSLPLFMELELDSLVLNGCYDVSLCSLDTIGFNSITAQIMKARVMPKRLGFSPFPRRAVEFCLSRNVRIAIEQSSFYDFETDAVTALLFPVI